MPQKQVSEELDGESYSWPTPGPSALACLRGNLAAPLAPAPPGYLFTKRDLPVQQPYYCRMRRPIPPCRDHSSWVAMGVSSAPGGPTLPNALCCPGVGEKLGNIIHNRLKGTVYPVLASVHSLGQGELDHCPVCGGSSRCPLGTNSPIPHPCNSCTTPAPPRSFSTHYSRILHVTSLLISWPHVPSGSFHCAYRQFMSL